MYGNTSLQGGLGALLSRVAPRLALEQSYDLNWDPPAPN